MDVPPAPDRNALAANLDMTLRQWVERYQGEVVFDNVRYRGVLSWKNVLDLWVIQEIAWETQVDAVIEIGVRHGGTTLWLSDLVKSFTGEEGVVVSIDLERPPIEFPNNVTFIVGDSILSASVARCAELCAGRRTMVIADGNHAADHVLQEMRLYTPLVSEGCYFIAEDGIVDVMEWKEFTPGPMVAAHRFVAENDEFIIDRSREKFLITYTPDGFLKRIQPARTEK
jgi:cephalosporin hydroxylase